MSLPEPEPTPSPTDPAAEDYSASSRAGSSTSNGAGPFVGDAGPGFDAAGAGDAPPAGPDVPLEAFTPDVDEEQIRSALRNLGDGAHAVIGVGELDWCMTQTDLERIAPPLTRIVNRYPALAAAAGHSDELAVAIGTGLYTWRSLLERQAVLRARETEDAAASPAGPPRPAAAPSPRAAPGGPAAAATPMPGGATVETPAGYTAAADRLRATRPQE
jgi:hypothetical protein